MTFLKKYYNLRANSILESIIALTIIAICLSIAAILFSNVFNAKTSSKFYNSQNKLNEAFFLYQINRHALEENGITLEEEIINEGLKKIILQYTNESNIKITKEFYVLTYDE